MEKFKSIVGYKAIKLELSRILNQLTNPEKYAAGIISLHRDEGSSIRRE